MEEFSIIPDMIGQEFENKVELHVRAACKPPKIRLFTTSSIDHVWATRSALWQSDTLERQAQLSIELGSIFTNSSQLLSNHL